MEILVCVKQVPDTAEVKIDPVKHTVIRAGVPNIFNPFDQNALEAALALKDADKDVKITLLSMGPDQAKDVLREGLAMGADDAYLLSDRKLGGSDTLATGYALAQAIKKLAADKGIEQFDIILCGKQAIDGDTAQVGPQIAEQLNIPQITYVEELTVSGDKVTARRKLEEGYSVVEAKLPVLITAIKELNTPRYMTPAGIFDAYKKEVKVWGFDDVPVDPEKIGLKGSPTNVRNTFSPDAKGHGMMLDGADRMTVKNLFDRLDEKHLL